MRMRLRLGGGGGSASGGGAASGSRYWRVYMSAPWSGANHELSEMAFYDADDNRLDGSGTADASNEIGGAVENLFDADTGTVWGSNVQKNQWVEYDFGSAVDARRLDITTSSSGTRHPQDVALFSSPDQTTWTFEWCQPIGGFIGNLSSRTFTDARVANTAYRYFRWYLIGSDRPYSDAVSELQFRESISGSDVSGTWTVTGTTTGAGAYANATDDDTGTSWESQNAPFDAYLQFDAGSGNSHTIVEMVYRGATLDKIPLRWKLQGSNDASAWSDIAYYGVRLPGEVAADTDYTVALDTV